MKSTLECAIEVAVTSQVVQESMAEPSRVLHLRNVGAEITEEDLAQLVRPFGKITNLVMVRTKNQALLQMQDITSSINAMHYFKDMQPSIRGRNVYIQFSSHQELITSDMSTQPRKLQEQDSQPNRILLITIHNPLYPITVDVLHQVFSPYGLVEKIVTFQKAAGLQALLQFASQHSALQSRNALQGRNIYDGCCTLDIQFSNLSELQVNLNNDRTRDYTNPGLPPDLPVAQGNMMSLFGDNGNIYGMQSGGSRSVGYQQVGPASLGLNSYQMPLGGGGPMAAAFGGSLPPGITGTNERTTLLATNINAEKVDADKLFNLFSNYGNIVRIKFLHNKPDHALVQMGDGLQAELAVTFLKGCPIFGKRMEVNYSKHPQINPSTDTHDYSSSNLNRFNRNISKNYRYCCAPTKMIHISSLPADATEAKITAYLAPHGNIIESKLFEANGKKQALVHFENDEQATEALVCKHATTFQGSTIRLAFSKSTSL
ncbi:hypothetical protein GOP47_0025262 [Adiantum capillus-veneris]|uniref:RRM domain-containing protein n=1 Tax=Adiantum capillus-veneris TaxID=13818 RepID=A0A9D4Z269_ADICA|nr:hypothetical protein GOP47_0025262 [Adiantum capillus-veneris]